MRIPALHAVECVILHETSNPLPSDPLQDSINEVFEQFGISHEHELLPTQGNNDLAILAGDIRVEITQNQAKYAEKHLKKPLSSPFTAMIFPEAEGVIGAHRAHTIVSIGKGSEDPTKLPPAMRKAHEDTGYYTDSREFWFASDLCACVAKSIAEKNDFSGIYWNVSEFLLPPDLFIEAVEDSEVVALNLNPGLYSSAGSLSEGAPIGMVANGSQYVLGSIVEFDEAVIPLNQMLETVNAFVKNCQGIDEMMPNKELFKTPDGTVMVEVKHKELPALPWNKVHLQLRKLKEKKKPKDEPSVENNQPVVQPETDKGTVAAVQYEQAPFVKRQVEPDPVINPVADPMADMTAIANGNDTDHEAKDDKANQAVTENAVDEDKAAVEAEAAQSPPNEPQCEQPKSWWIDEDMQEIELDEETLASCNGDRVKIQLARLTVSLSRLADAVHNSGNERHPSGVQQVPDDQVPELATPELQTTETQQEASAPFSAPQGDVPES